MAPKRSHRVLAIWIASIPALLAAVWLAGFLYWQMQIGRAISDLKNGPGRYATDPAYVSPELLRIGGRGIPRFIDELEAALQRGDEEQASAFLCGLMDLLAAYFETGPAIVSRATQDRVRFRSREQMVGIVRMYRESRDLREDLLPWWMWWTGQCRS